MEVKIRSKTVRNETTVNFVEEKKKKMKSFANE
jgi:hypothetical protein